MSNIECHWIDDQGLNKVVVCFVTDKVKVLGKLYRDVNDAYPDRFINFIENCRSSKVYGSSMLIKNDSEGKIALSYEMQATNVSGANDVQMEFDLPNFHQRIDVAPIEYMRMVWNALIRKRFKVAL
jgi:hypothetical protein